MQRDYHKPTLRKVSGKKSYYVFVTKPESLRRNPKDKQVRKSTGTSDLRIAEKLVHSVAEEIYREFDAQLNADPFIAFLRKHWTADYSFEEALSGPNTNPLDDGPDAADYRKITVCEHLCFRDGVFNDTLAVQCFQFLNEKEARAWKNWIEIGASPYPVQVQQKQVNDDLAKEALKRLKSGDVLNTTGAPNLTEFLDEYTNDTHRWKRMTTKEKGEQLRRLENVIDLIGDIPVDQVQRHHGIEIAQTLEEDGKANATIKAWVGSLRMYLTWVQDRQLNTFVSPPKPWISSNPLFGLSVAKYGKEKRSWKAFTPDQLHHLFSLEMPKEDRLLLSILVTTGMRLDEAALLEWDQYKVDRNGLRYFDLSAGAKVKTDKFSARTVALPDCLQLPPRAEGRLFSFRVNNDGKSSSHASKHLRQYTHAVRFDETDDRKVVHSLRHNLAGFMLNLTPTPSTEVMDWITGHGMDGAKTQSERINTYGQDPDVATKYAIVNRIEHPWNLVNY